MPRSKIMLLLAALALAFAACSSDGRQGATSSERKANFADCAAGPCGDQYLLATSTNFETNDPQVLGFQIDPDTGALTPLDGFPMALLGGNGSTFDLALNDAGTVLFEAAIGNPDMLHTYTGGGGAPFTPADTKVLGNGILRPIVYPGGSRVYVRQAGTPMDTLFGFDVAPDGVLTEIGGISWNAMYSWGFAFHPSGNLAFLAGDTSIHVATVDASGVITDLGAMATTADNIADLAVDPLGEYLAAFLYDGSVELYAISLAPAGIAFKDSQQPATCFGPNGIVADVLGRAFYATCSTQHEYGLGFLLDRDAQKLVPVSSTPSAGEVPLFDGRWPTLSRDGQFLYNAQLLDSGVSGYRIDSNTGALSPLPGSPFPVFGQPPGDIMGGVVTH